MTRPGLPALFLAALLIPLSLAARAEDRGTRIAMAVALLDVAGEHCRGLAVDEAQKRRLMAHFHEYDIAGLASLLSQPLNAFYEDFAFEAARGRDGFCRKAPGLAAGAGYPVLHGASP